MLVFTNPNFVFFSPLVFATWCYRLRFDLQRL